MPSRFCKDEAEPLLGEGDMVGDRRIKAEAPRSGVATEGDGLETLGWAVGGGALDAAGVRGAVNVGEAECAVGPGEDRLDWLPRRINGWAFEAGAVCGLGVTGAVEMEVDGRTMSRFWLEPPGDCAAGAPGVTAGGVAAAPRTGR